MSRAKSSLNTFNKPHPNSIAGRMRRSGTPKEKAALRAWESECIEDNKAVERWYRAYRRTF